MLSVKRVVVALAAANLAAISLVACSVRQTAEKVEQSVEMKYPEKEKKE